MIHNKFFAHGYKLEINWEDKFNQIRVLFLSFSLSVDFYSHLVTFRLQDYLIASQHAANQLSCFWCWWCCCDVWVTLIFFIGHQTYWHKLSCSTFLSRTKLKIRNEFISWCILWFHKYTSMNRVQWIANQAHILIQTNKPNGRTKKHHKLHLCVRVYLCAGLKYRLYIW